MKKIVIMLVVLFLIGGAVFAEGNEGPVSVDLSVGLYYDAYDLSELGDFAILAALFNMRGGILFGVGFNVMDFVTIGAEAGALGMYWYDSYGNYVTMLDLPFHAYADLHAGDVISLRAYGGGILIGAIANGIAYYVAPEAGARVSLGGFYVEGSYVFADTAFPRFGLGFTTTY